MEIFYIYNERTDGSAVAIGNNNIFIIIIIRNNNNIIMKINRKMSFFFRHVGRPVIINKYLDPVTLP